jgi:hypothetical protein
VKRIPALTLWRPWTACFTDLPEPIAKRHENRGWATNYRGDVYLHAGQRWDPSALQVVAEVEWMHGGCLPVGTATVCVDREPTLSPNPADHPTGIVAIAELVGVCSLTVDLDSRSSCDCGQWAFPGQYHWRFANVRKLPQAVPCRGAQQLWYPPDGVAAQVEQQLAVAR